MHWQLWWDSMWATRMKMHTDSINARRFFLLSFHCCWLENTEGGSESHDPSQLPHCYEVKRKKNQIGLSPGILPHYLTIMELIKMSTEIKQSWWAEKKASSNVSSTFHPSFPLPPLTARPNNCCFGSPSVVIKFKIVNISWHLRWIVYVILNVDLKSTILRKLIIESYDTLMYLTGCFCRAKLVFLISTVS